MTESFPSLVSWVTETAENERACLERALEKVKVIEGQVVVYRDTTFERTVRLAQSHFITRNAWLKS